MEEEIQEIAEVIIEEVVETPVPVEAAPIETIPVEELPVEVVADPGFWTNAWHGYLFGLDWIFPFMMMIAAYISLRHLIWDSLRFNYHHYLECGEFVLAWGDDGHNIEKKERRKKIAKQIRMTEPDFAAWFAALAMTAVVFVVCSLIGLAWPITIIFVFPLMIVRAIAYRKRRKIAFSQRLKGEHLDGSV